MPRMTLADLKAEADKKYQPLTIDDVTFRPLLRLGDQRRKQALQLAKDLDGLQEQANSNAEVLDEVTVRSRNLLVMVADDEDKAAVMLQALDSAEVLTLLQMWTESTQPGEAPSSPS